MMDDLGTAAVVAMVLMMVVLCGGMVVGMGWMLLRRQRSPHDDPSD